MKPNKVKGYRIMLGMTQKEIANKLDITCESYINKENVITAFNDNEKIAFKNILLTSFPKITLEDIFF